MQPVDDVIRAVTVPRLTGIVSLVMPLHVLQDEAVVLSDVVPGAKKFGSAP